MPQPLPTLSFPVRTDRKRRLRVDIFTGLLGLGLATFWLVSGESALMGLGTFAMGAWYLARAFRRARQRDPDAVELTAEGLLTRRSPLARTRSLIPYSEITALTDTAKGRLLFVGTDSALVIIDSQLLEGTTATELDAALRARIAQLPTGPAQLKRIGAEQARIEVLESRPTHVTRAILFAVALGFVLQRGAGALDGSLQSALANAQLGANVPALVLLEGEWYRLVSAAFLHGNFVHLAMNGLFLYLFGGLVERILGGWRTALVFLGSCVTGSLASLYLNNADLAVGASTGLFGLLGALAVVQLRFGRDLPLGFRQSTRWWIFSLGANALIPLMLPFIDGWGHLGGFIGGAALGWISLTGWRRMDAFPAPPFAISAASALTVGLTLALLGQAMQAAERFEPARMVRTLAAYEKTSAETLNLYAWGFGAANPDATQGMLNASLACAEAALSRADDDDKAELLDTLATLKHRLGDDAAAIAAERQAFVARLRTAPTSGFYATQLLRFVRARGPALRTVPAAGSKDAESIWRLRTAFFQSGFSADAAAPQIEGLSAPINYLAAWDSATDAPVGVLLVRGSQPTTALAGPVPPNVEWRLYLEASDGPESSLPMGSWAFLPIDAEATKLPRRHDEEADEKASKTPDEAAE